MRIKSHPIFIICFLKHKFNMFSYGRSSKVQKIEALAHNFVKTTFIFNCFVDTSTIKINSSARSYKFFNKRSEGFSLTVSHIVKKILFPFNIVITKHILSTSKSFSVALVSYK
ncbi:hypothetical protein H312_02768 [Anncaliia algerae PRA339]|uniref:Uncharacterized protein n=1 Tax=Anncaliia algerae PRA339 TaxID=1288291 RepID=A0A059EY86_9MICR|nr:hypothetical protein H312_02768 [Anncaliia algerae PRA339]